MIYNIDNLRIIRAESVDNLNNEQMYLLRGGPLDKINKTDKKVLLEKYNLKTVVDFRSKDERNKASNKIIEGVDYYNIEILDPDTSVHKNPVEFLQAYQDDHDLNFMEQLYSEFVLNTFSKNSFKKFLEVVAQSEGSVYFHCTAGKDRTGYASMLLLEILGANKADIFKDYLMTNDFTDDNYTLILEKLRIVYDNAVEDDHLKDLIGVKENFLDISRSLIYKDYECVVDFIEKELNIDKKTLDIIRSKFVV